jgi:hypothetical protein
VVVRERGGQEECEPVGTHPEASPAEHAGHLPEPSGTRVRGGAEDAQVVWVGNENEVVAKPVHLDELHLHHLLFFCLLIIFCPSFRKLFRNENRNYSTEPIGWQVRDVSPTNETPSGSCQGNRKNAKEAKTKNRAS